MIHNLSVPENLFLELLQVAVGTRIELSHIPSANDWEELNFLCKKHTLSGVGFYAIEKLVKINCEYKPPRHVFLEMFTTYEKLQSLNNNLVSDIFKLTRLFKLEGFDSCVLKGQGLARLYPKGMVRTPGDIDIWIAPVGKMKSLSIRRNEIIKLCRKVVGNRPVFYHHTDLPLKGKDIEVHFTPSWMFTPWNNDILQLFFEKEWEHKRYVEYNTYNIEESQTHNLGFFVPSLLMDAVYILLHIYRHIFSEGVGLRQILDYHIVLQQPNIDKAKVMQTLNTLGLVPFTRGMMWVLQMVFNTQENGLLCTPDENRGKLLLNEIMMSGNFGKWDIRLSNLNRDSLWERFYENMKRNIRLMQYYPSESFWAPIWRVWQKAWRMYNGY